ncbi:MAG: polyhydroxyalkanoate synthesis regulator DNA-binding domain-containing protein [Clostridia bacterium]|nr:polyhydroxyalkanoate synthesis regulator DNA-binding domain-containing protein [Deltaproteobacteria bacterium]
MSSPKIIKRYANRKLYDTERSSYVTLDDISVMIKAGEEVQVVDNKSGEDLTSVTLAQIIFEAEKRSSAMPLSLLRTLIRDGGDAIGGFAREQVEKVQTQTAVIRERAEKLRTDLEAGVDRVRSVIPTGVNGASGGPAIIADLVASSQKAIDATHKTIDELQKGLEDKFKGGVGAMSRFTFVGREMDEIRKRLADLENRLEKLPPS